MDSFITLVCSFRSQSQTMLLSCMKRISGFYLHSEYNLNIFAQTLTSWMKWILLPLSFICYAPSHLLFSGSWNIASSFPLGLELFSLPFTWLTHPWDELKYHHPERPSLTILSGQVSLITTLLFSVIALMVSFTVPRIICHCMYIVYVLVTKTFTYL